MIHALAQAFPWLEYLLMLLAGVGLFAAERYWPRRSAPSGQRGRWVANLGLYALGLALAAAAMQPVQAAAIRLGALPGWGGLAALPLPDAPKLALGVLLADAVQYALHRLSHAVPLLWRLHQVHHADAHVDVSTTVRHHPLERLALGALTFLACTALGVPLLSLLLYALLLVPLAVFSHANVALPRRVDRCLRWLIVTPDMHRIHHAARMDEGNRNFGMAFPWWDRLLRTYCAQPGQGHQAMPLGLVPPDTSGQGLWDSIAQPFRRGA